MSVLLDMPLERGRIERGENRIKIVVPAFTTMLLLGAGTLALMLSPFVTPLLRNGINGTIEVVVLVCFALPIVGVLIWAVTGRTVYDVDQQRTLRITYRILGLPVRVREFALGRMSELRTADTRGGILGEMSGGPIAFKYHGTTHYIGLSMGSGDASVVVANIIDIATPLVERIDMGVATPEPPAQRSGWNAASVAEQVSTELAGEASARAKPPVAEVAESRRAIRIDVPPARDSHASAIPLFIVILSIAAVAMFYAGVPRPIQVTIGMVAGFAIGAALTGWALLALAVTMFRRETITVDEKQFVIERRVLFYRTAEVFEIVQRSRIWLDDAYYQQAVGPTGKPQARLHFSLDHGPLVYQDGDRTVVFGDGLKPYEAMSLMDRVIAKVPSLEH